MLVWETKRKWREDARLLFLAPLSPVPPTLAWSHLEHEPHGSRGPGLLCTMAPLRRSLSFCPYCELAQSLNFLISTSQQGYLIAWVYLLEVAPSHRLVGSMRIAVLGQDPALAQFIMDTGNRVLSEMWLVQCL